MVCRWDRGGGLEGLGVCLVKGKRLLSKLSPTVFLEALTEGDVPTEAGRLFQYFTTLTENADPLHLGVAVLMHLGRRQVQKMPQYDLFTCTRHLKLQLSVSSLTGLQDCLLFSFAG